MNQIYTCSICESKFRNLGRFLFGLLQDSSLTFADIGTPNAKLYQMNQKAYFMACPECTEKIIKTIKFKN